MAAPSVAIIYIPVCISQYYIDNLLQPVKAIKVNTIFREFTLIRTTIANKLYHKVISDCVNAIIT